MAEGVPVKEHSDFFNNLNDKYSPFSHLIRGKMYKVRDKRRVSGKHMLFSQIKTHKFRSLPNHKQNWFRDG